MCCWPKLATFCKPWAVDSVCRGGVTPISNPAGSSLTQAHRFLTRLWDTQPKSHMHDLVLNNFKTKPLQYHLMELAHNFMSSYEDWEIQVSVLA